jgi:hypothetical protein
MVLVVVVAAAEAAEAAAVVWREECGGRWRRTGEMSVDMGVKESLAILVVKWELVEGWTVWCAIQRSRCHWMEQNIQIDWLRL